MMNVCRHRGSRSATSRPGTNRAWCAVTTAGPTGSMAGSAARSHAGRLRPVAAGATPPARVFTGLIFVSFADEPPAFEPIEQDLGEPLRPYGLDRAKSLTARTIRSPRTGSLRSKTTASAITADRRTPNTR